jgi:4-diphosphocytidyl-2C-methyl-D-erythritol kinase
MAMTTPSTWDYGERLDDLRNPLLDGGELARKYGVSTQRIYQVRDREEG